MSCISLTRRTHKLEEIGMTSKMHPRIKTRVHLSAVQRKAGPGECHFCSADPLLGSIGPKFLQQSPIAPLHIPSASNRGSTLERLHKEEESPLFNTHHHHVELVLHCKGEALPRLVLRVAGG